MNIGILSNMKGMNAIMAALITAAVMDAAACHDRNIRAIRNIEIIINQIGHSGNADHHWNKNSLSFCIAINQDIDARLIFFFADPDMLTVP